MAEQLDLASPEQDAPGTVTWNPFRLIMDTEKEHIKASFRGDNGEYKSIGYDGTEALSLIRALMTSDLSAKSGNRRIMEKAVADGKLSGTISGTPD